MKGRKTDVADSLWLACVCQFGLCTPSHVPPAPFQELRSLSRQRRTLVGQCATVRNRTQKIIDRAGVRIGGILSNIFGVNGHTILDGLAAGEEREIIALVERSHLPVRRTLDRLGIPSTTFYRWCDRYRSFGMDGLEDRCSGPGRVWPINGKSRSSGYLTRGRFLSLISPLNRTP